MVRYDPWQCLPTSAELPDSDDTPVDNELQNLIPNLLAAILAFIWADRGDWFFGVDMGIYYAPGEPPIVSDGFLSLGVDRFVGEEGRLSYVLWEEDNKVPLLALEVVSKTYSGEYEQKKIDYARLGILYYVIYAPGRGKRRKRKALEVYRLVDGQYVLQTDEPYWMPDNWLRDRARARNASRLEARMALLVRQSRKAITYPRGSSTASKRTSNFSRTTCATTRCTFTRDGN